MKGKSETARRVFVIGKACLNHESKVWYAHTEGDVSHSIV